RQIAAGVFQKLDKSKLPNLKNMWDVINQRIEKYDPGNQYAVDYMWGTTGLGYNVDKMKEILGSDARPNWDILFKPEMAAKFKDCGVHVLDSASDVLPST
ncbi:spermidine/putrescine ABC transporter substrate-binding protein PotF, partial [Enterobacter hormaechei]|nr:spermidine/putrescine ABC transporter substrate-binding protein PotF [Enterobacter hormaechei]